MLTEVKYISFTMRIMLIFATYFLRGNVQALAKGPAVSMNLQRVRRSYHAVYERHSEQ